MSREDFRSQIAVVSVDIFNRLRLFVIETVLEPSQQFAAFEVLNDAFQIKIVAQFFKCADFNVVFELERKHFLCRDKILRLESVFATFLEAFDIVFVTPDDNDRRRQCECEKLCRGFETRRENRREECRHD